MKISIIQIERLMARLQKIWSGVRGFSHQRYVWDRIDEYQAMWQAVARKLGAEMTPLARDLWELSLGNKKTRILNDKLEYDNPVTLVMAGRKHLVYKLLSDSGLRVPDHRVFRLEEQETALEFLHRYPSGCVIKPANGTSSGQGVTTHVQTDKEVRKASILASLYCPELMIEPMIAGECYRLLVLNGEVIHAVCRCGRQLTGNGVASIAELITAESSSLEIDRDCLFTLSYQGLSLTSVPAAGHRFLVKTIVDAGSKNAEVRTVYNADVTDSIGTFMKNDAVRAAEALGSVFVGVDFITTDMSLSLEDSGGFINELNTTPGLHHHCGYEDEQYSPIALRVISPLLR